MTPQESLPIVGLVPPVYLQAKGLEPPHWLYRPILDRLTRIGITSTSMNHGNAAGAEDYSAELRRASSFDKPERKCLMLVPLSPNSQNN